VCLPSSACEPRICDRLLAIFLFCLARTVGRGPEPPRVAPRSSENSSGFTLVGPGRGACLSLTTYPEVSTHEVRSLGESRMR
jgi:hypothetical protein